MTRSFIFSIRIYSLLAFLGLGGFHDTRVVSVTDTTFNPLIWIPFKADWKKVFIVEGNDQNFNGKMKLPSGQVPDHELWHERFWFLFQLFSVNLKENEIASAWCVIVKSGICFDLPH